MCLEYYNYKKYNSIVLQAVAGSDLQFLKPKVGAFGRDSDGGNFDIDQKAKKVSENDYLQLGRKELLDKSAILPYFVVGDAAYPTK